MSRKTYFTIFLAIVFLAVGSGQAFAQSASLRGRIVMKQDGADVPVVGATVEVYRVDTNGKYSNTVTDKRGYFTFAGLLLGNTYFLNISGPGVSPLVIPNIRAGMEVPDIIARAGDGKKYTEEESRNVLKQMKSGGPSQEETAESKKAREEYEKKVKDVEEKNKKAQASNEIVNRALQDGGKAYEAKDYTTAIAKFQEGIDADPTFAGSAPVLLNNKALSLINRATESFNNSIKDPANKETLKAAAKQDLEGAITSTEAAIEIIKTASPTDDAQRKNLETNNILALTVRKSAFRLLAQTGLDINRGTDAAAAYAAYLAVETDADKKAKGQLELAQTLQASNEFELAFEEFKKINAVNPNDLDALVGMGLTLTNVGYMTMDTDAAKGKAQLQDAVNYLQQYVDLAPDGHKYKSDAKEAIVSLKEIVTPQKTKTTPAKKKN